MAKNIPNPFQAIVDRLDLIQTRVQRIDEKLADPPKPVKKPRKPYSEQRQNQKEVING